MSSIINKVKDAITPNSGAKEGEFGPHSTRAGNAADPRIDSDHDRSATLGHSTGTTGITGNNHGLNSASGPAPNTAGPHKSDMMNRVDPRIDSDKDNSHTLGGNPSTGTHVPEGATGPHGNRVANILDPRVDSDKDRTVGPGSHSHPASGPIGNTFGTTGTTGTHGLTGTHGTSEGLHGPHGNRAANALDPTVDSDRDGSNTLGNRTHGNHGLTGTHGTSGLTGTHGTSGLTGTHGTSEGAHGPHGNRAANALDPTVDSDRDGSHTLGNRTHGTSGLTGTHGTSGLTGTHGTSGLTGTHGTSGLTGTHGTSGLTGTHGTSEGAHGPHGNRVANALDPTVDSDRDGSKTLGNRTHGTGLTGTHGTHGTSGLTGTHGTSEGVHGPHGNRAANALDPTVDSDRDGSKTVGNRTHGATTGEHITGRAAGALGGPESVGPAPHTAGPHKSDILNKLDPRVDSDLDGSKTFGGDKTFAQS